MVNGIVKWFNSLKGYGFITTDKGEDVFIHFSGILDDENGFRTLYEGDKVEFEIIENQKGKQAKEVRITAKGPRMKKNTFR
ncbi:MAG: cold-shock protein [Promethearchaeota archaeon]